MQSVVGIVDDFLQYVFGTPSSLLFFVPLFLIALVIVNRFGIVPNKLQSFVEVIFEFLESQFRSLFKKEDDYKRWMPFFLTIFVYILVLNLVGLIPRIEAPTSDIWLTGSMALMIFIISTFIGIKHQGPIRYFILLTPSGIATPLRVMMFPIEFVSMLAKPFSLAVRLYANMFAGHTIIKTILGLTEIFQSKLILPIDLIVVVALLGFEVFVALIQAFIFAYLSAIYIADNLYMGDH